MRTNAILIAILCTFVCTTTLFGQITGEKPRFYLSRYNFLPNVGRSPVVLNDTLGIMGFQGYLSSGYFYRSAGIYSIITDIPTATGFATRMTFATGANGLQDRMTILENGFVGINTNTPGYHLHVNGDAFIDGDFTVGGDFKVLGSIEAGLDVIAGRDVKAGRNVEAAENVSGKNLLASQNVAATGDVSGTNIIASNNVSAVNVNTTNVNASNTISATGNITSLSAVSGANLNASNNLFVNGRIGLGTDPTAAPGTHRLYIAGSAIAEEVKVELQGNWPDYVFESTYQLPELEAIANYVKLNKHLPNIPTASEVAQSGLALGETQRLMMEKIEELYLHLIQLDQRIKQLETENKALKAQQK